MSVSKQFASSRNVLEEQAAEDVLQGIVAEAPWLIEPTWTPITANQSLKLFARKFGEYYRSRHNEDVTFVIDHPTKQPDFTLVNVSRKLHIVEIKATGHRFNKRDWDRLHRYLEAFEAFLAENVQLASEFPDGWVVDLVCDSVGISDRDKRRAYEYWQAESRIEQITWTDFLARAVKANEAFLDAQDLVRKGRHSPEREDRVLMRAVSLFSNCGAGDVGYAAAGFRFGVISEVVDRRLEVAALNHPGAKPISGDLRTTWPLVVDAFREAHGSALPVLLSGCPPCQGMSTARGHRGREDDPDASSRDTRNLLVLPIAAVAKELQPMFIVVENVPAFLRRMVWDPDTGAPLSAAAVLSSRLQSDYRVYAAVVDLCEYGVPQTRVRAFLTLVRRDTEALEVLNRTERAPFPAPTHGGPDLPDFLTIDALSQLGLPPLDAGSADTASSKDHAMHRVPVWLDRRYDVVAAIPPGSGASAWETDSCQQCGTSGIGSREAVCPSCESPVLRPTVRDADGSWRLVRGFRNSSYRRMTPGRPAATITTASGHIGSDRTLHPSENRVLSPAECAWLQTFPETFRWGDSIDKWGHTGVRGMIGEAVPPRFTMLHGKILRGLAEGGEVPEAMSSARRAVSKGTSKTRSLRVGGFLGTHALSTDGRSYRAQQAQRDHVPGPKPGYQARTHPASHRPPTWFSLSASP